MPDKHEPSIPLDYAGQQRSAKTIPAARVNQVPSRQLTLTSPIPILQNASRADVAFAARALQAAGIPAVVSPVPTAKGDLRRPQILLVDTADAQRASTIVQQTLTRRTRLASMPRQNNDRFKPQSQGGTWPDDYRPVDII